MNYIVVDFEFNQAYDFELNQKVKSNPELPFEIIQMGAIKLNEDFEEIETLNILIKPSVYTPLNPHVSQLTNITDADLETRGLKDFETGLKVFLEFCGDDRPVLCIWGKNDISTLYKNTEYHNIKNLNLPVEYINLQDYTSKKLKHFSGTHIGLKNAVTQLNLDLGLEFHDALNDAKYTAEIFKIYKNTRFPIAKYSNKHLNKNKTYNPRKTRSNYGRE